MIDRSGSVPVERFREVKDFMSDVVQNLEIWQDRVRESYVTTCTAVSVCLSSSAPACIDCPTVLVRLKLLSVDSLIMTFGPNRCALLWWHLMTRQS